jgi:hypothetical protein
MYCGICLKFVCDESSSVSEDAVERWKKSLPSLLQDYVQEHTTECK